jgi:hypothetical protein
MIIDVEEVVTCEKCKRQITIKVFMRDGDERVGHFLDGNAVGWGYVSSEPGVGICPECRKAGVK